MKKITLFAAFALVALLSSQAIAASPKGLYDVIFGSATTTISVQATQVKNQSMTVQILNENEEYIVNEKFKNQADFIKKYDLVNMKDGDYKLIINKSNCRITQPFSIDGGYVQLTELEKETTYFPVFVPRKADCLDINVLSEKYGDIIVNVLDDNNDTVFTETTSDAHLLHKRYDFSDLNSGKYVVEVVMNGEAFYYDLKK